MEPGVVRKKLRPISEETQEIIQSLKALEDSLSHTFKKLSGPKPEPPPLENRDQPTANAVRGEKVDVFVRVVFLKLGEVDTVNERFMADVYIQAHWKEPSLDKTGPEKESDLPNWSNYWNPKLYVENGLGDLKETVWYSVGYSDDGKATVYQKRRLKGTYFEKMELHEYPFDTQDLTVTVTTERADHEVQLYGDPVEVSSINVQSFVDEQEWKLHKHVNTATRVTSNLFKNTKHKHPAISISCRVTRRVAFFMWNVIIIMIFISSLVFTTWTVEQDRPQNRLQLSFILLLSNITFKFTVSQTLPKVPYLTILDKYILYSMAQLCFVCVWHAIAAALLFSFPFDKEMAAAADQIALYSQGALYIIFNLCFFMHGRWIMHRRLKEFARKDLRHQEKLKAMDEILILREEKSFRKP